MGCPSVSVSPILPAARAFAIFLYASNSGQACFSMYCDEDAWICRAPLKESPCIKEREACIQCYRGNAQVSVSAKTTLQSFSFPVCHSIFRRCEQASSKDGD